jgi:DNA-binding response OmpR family regulator
MVTKPIQAFAWYGTCICPRMQVRNGETKTVLIADDDAWLREMLTTLLDYEGFRPLAARTGPEAVHAAREYKPDVILLDVALPGRSGFDVLKDLRKASSTQDIPVMLVSGEINLVETGHAYDADAAFHKPLDFSAVLAKVRQATGC